MRLLVDAEFPGWRLRSLSNERMHWAARWRAGKPPIPPTIVLEEPDARVARPHARRRVEITRIGPRELDVDNLHSAIKPALDWCKAHSVRVGRSAVRICVPGWIYDDAPRYVRLVARQERGEYAVRVRIYG